jgi:hypothetical protein
MDCVQTFACTFMGGVSPTAEEDRKMADRELSSPLAPVVGVPERGNPVYEAKQAPNAPGGRGPLRFEEGLATDTDVPNDFMVGMGDGYRTGARPNQNAVVWLQDAATTMKQRAHLGSAAWPESTDYTGAFAEGAGPEAERKFIEVDRSGGRYERISPARIVD